MLTEEDKERNLIIKFTIWLKATAYNRVPTSSGIISLQKFMVTELHLDKKKAGQKILWFFQEHQQLSADELILVWEELK